MEDAVVADETETARGGVVTPPTDILAPLGPVEKFLERVPLPPDEYVCRGGMVMGEQSKYLSWDFPDTLPQITIIQITDVQFGHVCCKYSRVIEFRDWVLADPTRFMIWTGDMIDAWAAWSPGRPYENIADPQTQVFKFCEAWAPARHRVLGYVGGNHERRAIPGFGDLGVLLAMLLKIPYSNGKQHIDVHFGKHTPFKITQWHGRGGARTKGTVAQTLHRFASEGDSQLYLMGHLHQPLIMPFWKERRGPNQRVVLQKCVAALGSSFLEHYGTYGEVAGYSGHDVLMPCTVLEPDGKWVVLLR